MDRTKLAASKAEYEGTSSTKQTSNKKGEPAKREEKTEEGRKVKGTTDEDIHSDNSNVNAGIERDGGLQGQCWMESQYFSMSQESSNWDLDNNTD